MARKCGERERWARVKSHLERVQTIVGGNSVVPVTSNDAWWARKVLHCLLSDPIPKLKSELRRNEGFIDYRPAARILLAKLDELWPEEEFPEANGKPVKKYTEPGARLVTQCALRGVRKRLKETRNQLAYWEPRYAKLPLYDKRWKEVHEKVNELRGQAAYFQSRIQQLKEKL